LLDRGSVRIAGVGDVGSEAALDRVELPSIDWDNGTCQPMHVRRGAASLEGRETVTRSSA
jgi:hypothetical protein